LIKGERKMKKIFSKILGTVLLCLIIVMVISGGCVVFAAKFSPGDIVGVINTLDVGLRVRDNPAGNITGKKYDGDRGMILEGPQTATLDGIVYTWWKVRWEDALEGWSAEGYPGGVDYLQKVYISPSTKFNIGDDVTVYNTGGLGLVVRTDPPVLAYYENVPDGTTGKVVDGPFYGVPKDKAGFYYFWKVDYGGMVGWSAEDWLIEVTIVGEPVITSSLVIVQSPPYYIGDTITATFTITNKATGPFTFDVLAVGGRDPDGQVADFTWRTSINLNPSESYNYQGTLTLTKAGNYHFFCAYRRPDGSWNTAIPTESGVTNVLDIVVKARPLDITTDTTWYFSQSPYIVTGDVTVFPNCTLTIEPGVEVRFYSDTGMQVRGTLMAEGAESSPIVFTSADSVTKGAWKGIEIANTLGGRATIKFAYFSYASTALRVQCCWSGGPVEIYDSVFANNVIALGGYAGWKMVVERCTFQNNTYAVTSADKIISQSVFKNNQYGLYATERVSVYYSVFEANDVALYGGRGEVKFCQITHNGIGVQSFFEGFTLSNNTIANNNVGVILGQYDTYSAPVEYNEIYNNVAYNLKNTGDANKLAKYNWWGTTDPYEIEMKIHDGYDDASVGVVEYSPILTGPLDITPSAVEVQRAITTGPGGIFKDTTWSLSQSPYIITEDLTLFPGYTLTIEPGVEVKFSTGTKLTIRGSLVAEGTESNRIAFSSTEPATKGSWGGIDVATHLGAKASIKFASFSYAQTAIYVHCCWKGGPVNVYDSAFTDNVVALGGYAGWEMIVERCIFERNTYAVTSADKRISNSIFRNNDYGLYATERISIYSSTFTENQVALYGGRGEVKNCEIFNNHIGVQSFFEGFTLSQNTIKNNDVGVILGSYDTYSAPVYLNDFINNAIQVQNPTYATFHSPAEITYIYNGKTFTNYLGNYWSDYTGSDADGDGIGNTPYIIDSGMDTYPLIKPFENYFISVYPPENLPPTCAIKLQKAGVEINEINVGEFFDIYVGGSTDDTGIVHVRFSSDDVQDGIPTGEWTKWYNWSVSEGDDWNAVTKIKRWAFATPWHKEVWAEVEDDVGQSDSRFMNILAILPGIVIIAPLEITPNGPYYVGETLTATFTIKNIGSASATLDVLTVGGRDLDGLVLDFEWEMGITLNPNAEYRYSGRLTLPRKTGTYHFFCAYRTQYGYWNPSIDLSEGLTDEDRVEDIIVYETPYEYPLGGIIIPEEIFPEGKGQPIPIYVPPVLEGSNVIREDDSWRTVKVIEKSRLNFEWEKMVTSFEPEQAQVWSSELNKYVDTPQGAAISFISGFLTAVNKATSRTDFKITVQQSSEGKFRAIIEMGDTETTTFMRTNAGRVYTVVFEMGIVREAFSRYLAEVFHLGPPAWDGFYTMSIVIDQSHKEDQYLYYISLSRDNRIVITPKVYPQDKLTIIQMHYIMFWKVETLVELTGNNFVSFGASIVGEEESKYILEILAPICLVPESAIIAQGHSPIELRVYDSQGRVTGLINGEIKEEIPNSIYNDESKTVIIFNPFDAYFYEVVGTNGGTYGLDITFLAQWNATAFTASQIPITNGSIHLYNINWDAIYVGEEGVTVNIDADSDGVFEHTFTSDGELTQSEYIIATDNTPPETLIFIGYPKFVVDDITYLTSATSISLIAVDNVDGSGVALTGYKIHNGSYDSGWINYTQSFYLIGLSDGVYYIDFNSTDYAGNVEPTNTITVILDNTPPKTTITIGEPKYVSDTIYVTPETPFTLDAGDGEGSGIFSTAYRIYNSTYDSGWLPYTGSFNLTALADGVYTIEFNSVDNLGNVETTKSIQITLFSWNYIFTDSYGRGTMLKINLAHKFFQFITPDKDYGIRKATYMRAYKRAIIICHQDNELKLATVSVDTQLDFCIAYAKDTQTGKEYWLIDKVGTEN
jgi:hypothetical protein